jgi:hypothetical protein
MKKIKLNNRIYDVVTNNNNIHNQYQRGDVAVQCGDYILPYLGAGGVLPGFYSNPVGSYYIKPQEQNQEPYMSSNILNFDDCENMKELIQMNHMLKELESEVISSSTEAYVPKINQDDTPEMAGLRQAIIEKHIDIDKYQDRFGASFNNDKRIISNSNSITFPKLKSISDNLDMNVTLIIEDKPGAPNPIGREIKIPLNYIGEDEE